MKSPRNCLVFACLVAGSIGFPMASSALPMWEIDYKKSRVSFVVEQAGAEFEGRWGEWDAQIQFDPEVLSESYAIAKFRVSSVFTFDAERDETLQDREWFDGATHPVATFEAKRFGLGEDGQFEAGAELEIKGRRTPLTFVFTYEEMDGVLVLKGEAQIDRLAAGIGTGEWMDTAWIGQFVRVKVMLYATLRISPNS